MKRSSRLLLAGVVIEVLLAWLAVWLLSSIANGSLQTSVPPQEASATITSTLGAIMVGLAALLGVAWFMMRRRGL